MTSPPAPACPTTTRLYEGGGVVAEGFAVADIPGLLDEHPDAVVWLDLFDPDENALRTVAAQFGLHPLAVEDAVHDHQRPKLDRYPGHLFMNVYDVRVSADGPVPHLHKVEISAFLTGRALITVRKSAGDVSRLARRWDADAELARHGGVAFLVYGLLDVVVDGQFAAARTLDEAMDRAEDTMLEEGGAPRPVRMYAFGLRKSLAALRRAVAPMPELIAQVLRLEEGLVDEHLAPYYRDVDDHARRAAETIDHALGRINGLLEADLTEQSNALNDVTRKLAAWAAIIAVPTALTGFFGQNVPYWGYERVSGFVASLVLMVVSAGGLYIYLKRRGWL
ncbi:magnesium transporter CorA [Actinoplanes sp. NBRC 14428]|uniref:Magnesium transporter n=1 Tax=Pseudosporangium ferrugineum TaxID=439699 RepID=A0A2T0RQL6_9ACTN|nr:magnesium transporter CorA family protein [Pseudosporangium ferrugineum]PRY23432.1 magnesium transporter [Pseudosporangium ferrugineum]BCJ55435.1 magnesium transporter CorA [Actinoplanes sp. NBRC 14428]